VNEAREQDEDAATGGYESAQRTRRARSLPELPPHLVIQRVLGEGGTSIVFEALHTRLRVSVAVKVLMHRDPHDTEPRERLKHEAELYARLRDWRVPRVYDVDELSDGTPYMVMELIRGRTLAELLEHGPLSEGEACTIALEALEIVAAVHAESVIHRDIKPANIILQPGPAGGRCVRIVDFGIAKTPVRFGELDALSRPGLMFGTPYYMAPEQISGLALDARADLYAIGVVLYEMLAGVVPYDGPNVSDVIAAALRDTPTPLATLRPDVSRELAAFVTRAMARERHDRFASAKDMLRALQAAGGASRAPTQLVTVEAGLAEAHEAPEPEDDTDNIFGAETPRTLLVLPDDDTAEALAPVETTTRTQAPSRGRRALRATLLAASLALSLWPTHLADTARSPSTLAAGALADGYHLNNGRAARLKNGALPAPIEPAKPPAPKPPPISATLPVERTDQPGPAVPHDQHRSEPEARRHARHPRKHVVPGLPSKVRAPFEPELHVVPVPPTKTSNGLPPNPY
jgi:serine/threonine protein kinase